MTTSKIWLLNWFEVIWRLASFIFKNYKIFNDVLSFATLNQDEEGYDESTNHFFIGNLAACFTWVESNYNLKELAFVTLKNLKLIYTDLLNQGVFDRPQQTKSLAPCKCWNKVISSLIRKS